jgi:hypothetical protein
VDREGVNAGEGAAGRGARVGGKNSSPVIIFILLKQLQFYCLYFDRMFSAIF